MTIPVVCDADVLSAPLSRTFLLRCSGKEGGFVVRWSPSIERQAESALQRRKGATAPVSLLHDIYPLALMDDPPTKPHLIDTHPGDHHVITLAAGIGAHIIVTRNVTDFGVQDLDRLHITAVHVDRFLAAVVPPSMYREVVQEVAARRSRPPNTPETLHASIGAEHPLLFARAAHLFPGIAAEQSAHAAPRQALRGTRCLRCGRQLTDPLSIQLGVGPTCR